MLNRIILMLFIVFSEISMLNAQTDLISSEIEITIDNTNIGSKKLILSQIEHYLSHSESDKATKLIFQILSLEELNTDTINLCKILLSEAYRQKREYSKGKEILFRVLKTPNLSSSNKAYLYNRLAALFAEGGTSKGGSRHDSVIAYSNLSVAISSKYQYDKLKCLSYNELGFAYNKLGDTAKSRYYLELAYQGFMEQKDTANIMHTSINLSNAYYSLGNTQKAITILDEAIDIGKPNFQKNLYMRLYLQKSDFLYIEGNYKLAYEFVMKSRKIQQDFYHDRINMQINEMSAAYDLQLKEARILEVEKENKIERQQTRFLVLALLASLIIIVFLVISFLLRRKLLIQKRELVKSENMNLKKDLEFKNKELVTNALTMAQQMEYNIDISERLKAIMPIGNEKVKYVLFHDIG